jgi:prepilin-type N-terminal cleavage/methylation domain-containing protein
VIPFVKKIFKTHKTARQGEKTHGFTLVELLLSMVLGAILMSTVAFIFANMASSFAEQPTTSKLLSDYGDWIGDRPIPMAPAYSQLSQAFNLQSQIISELQTSVDASGNHQFAHSIYVVTDEDGNLPQSGDADYSTTSLSWYAAKSPAEVASSEQFQSLYTATDNATEGYSIYFVRGESTVDLIVHVRKYTVDTITIYVVKTFVNGTFDETLSYAYGIKTADEANSPVVPSAERLTLRKDADWLIYDEIGTRVIFPDPTALPYQIKASDNSSKTRAFSRFVALLPVKQ